MVTTNAVDNPSSKNFQADATTPGCAVFQTCTRRWRVLASKRIPRQGVLQRLSRFMCMQYSWMPWLHDRSRAASAENVKAVSNPSNETCCSDRYVADCGRLTTNDYVQYRGAGGRQRQRQSRAQRSLRPMLWCRMTPKAAVKQMTREQSCLWKNKNASPPPHETAFVRLTKVSASCSNPTPTPPCTPPPPPALPPPPSPPCAGGHACRQCSEPCSFPVPKSRRARRGLLRTRLGTGTVRPTKGPRPWQSAVLHALRVLGAKRLKCTMPIA